MIRKNRIILIISLLLISLLFTGCSFIGNPMRLVEEDSVRVDVEDIMNAIETEDIDYIYNTYFNNDFVHIDRDEIAKGMEQILDAYKGERVSSELYSTHVNTYTRIKGNKESSETKVVVYLINTTESTYALTLSYQKDSKDNYVLVGVNLREFLDYVVNSKFSDYSFKNWILISLSIISYGIMILALILCIKTKIKLKPLWIILILIQSGVTITAFPTNFSFYVSFIQLFGMSKYLLYAHGGTITSVFIHIFAIVFLFVRKSLNNSYLRQQELYSARAESQQRYEEDQAEKVSNQITMDTNSQI